jgi:uncharacterized membrane protein
MTDLPPPAKKPWMKYLLIGSLAVNLLIVGLVIGVKVSGHTAKTDPLVGASGLRAFMHALPDNKRDEVRAYFRTNRSQIRANGDALHEAMRDIREAIIAQPFNPDVLNRAFAEQRNRIITVTQDAQQAFVVIITDMTDAQRREFVENMNEQRRKWKKIHKRKRNPQ